MLLMWCSFLHGNDLDKWVNNGYISLVDSSDVSNAPPRNLHTQLEESLVTFHLDGVQELLTVSPAFDRPIGNLASGSRYEEVDVHRQITIPVTSREEGREGCISVAASVVEALACPNRSIPVIETCKE